LLDSNASAIFQVNDRLFFFNSTEANIVSSRANSKLSFNRINLARSLNSSLPRRSYS
jgi:hypothetical protein